MKREVSDDGIVCPSSNEVKIVSDQGKTEIVDHWYENNMLLVKIKINPEFLGSVN